MALLDHSLPQCCGFARQTFATYSPGVSDGEPGLRKDHREIEIEKFITHRSWRRYMAQLKGPLREIKARSRQRT